MLLTNTRYVGPDFRLHRGDIRTQASHIVEIKSSLVPNQDEAVYDCSHFLIYPALADSHVHTPDTLFRGLFSDKPLHSWYDDTAQGRLQQRLCSYVDAAVNTPHFSTLVLYAYLQYLKAGVVCIVETGQADDSSKALETCARQIGIKALVDWYEDVPEEELKTDSIIRGTHLPEEEEIQEATLQEAIKRVRETGMPLMTHCLETPFRRSEILRKFGLSTVELLDKHNLLDEQTILFHCVETSKEDRSLLAASKALIVHCPISNRISGAHEMALGDLLSRGARIGLGTDYLTHDIWEVMRTTYAELKQCADSKAYDAKTVWKLATASPSPSLYQGKIEEGARADLLFVRNASTLSPLLQTDAFSTIAYNTLIHTRPEHIDSVMIDGRFVIKNKQCTTLDEAALENAYTTLVQSVFASELV